MASPLRAAAAMLKKHAPGALCFEIDLTRQSFVAGATRAVAVLVPDLSLEVVPGSLAKLHPQGFQAIPVSQTFRQGVATLAPSQGKSEKHQGVIELLKEQLSSVTEKVGQLETENRKLREDASKRERELSHELQTEISRQAHKENTAQIRNDEIRLEIEKLRVMKGGDEGGAKGLDTRNEILDIGICPCGIPWPEVCCKCGRSLPPFAADAAFLFGHASVGKDGTHTSAGQSVSKIGPAN
ncbi:hypothetical protein TRIUR3_18557 [Triticum urartu]|uniref:Uncharacterized protein n=1 Tax=Triticum urartu TaxID=4572 RepID=M7ZFQ0_TRIUA|nr:hypothetical protein TRIUR3_18557 [Triticum urartu]